MGGVLHIVDYRAPTTAGRKQMLSEINTSPGMLDSPFPQRFLLISAASTRSTNASMCFSSVREASVSACTSEPHGLTMRQEALFTRMRFRSRATIRRRNRQEPHAVLNTHMSPRLGRFDLAPIR